MTVFPGEITGSLPGECPERLLITLQMTIIIIHLHQGRTAPGSPLNLTRAGDNEGFSLVWGQQVGGQGHSHPVKLREWGRPQL